jgi:beta-phosphoglucomutase-like phosphatase (HAD superfamily)
MNNSLGVIFDMDGVLIDSYRAHFKSWQAMAAEMGLTITESQFAATFGRTSREAIAALWGPRRFSRRTLPVWMPARKNCSAS